MASVKVAVRVRPLNKREIGMNAKCVINMDNKRTTIINLKNVSNDEEISKEHVKDFFFDYSYWSCDENARNYSGQSVVYNDLGTGVVKAADEGYNACIFAYGQTGSGKTHTMMGQQGNEGLIPRICENLFRQMHQKEDEGVSFRIEVSYLEIYNEKVRDLLRAHQPKAGQPLHTMKVREHPKEGPYVQGLTKHLVGDYNAIEAIMKQGNELRTTASTNMNDTSSRSHAIFTIRYTQAKFLHDMPSETTSKINLVDLAGSERADSTGATGVRLKEGANINKSLVTLGSVISSLAEASTSTGKKGHVFVPYRDSVLTWLLKDSLGGNSKTIMIAAISPADVNYSETLSTLRYANRAKNIINKPTVNEDTNVKLIRDLRAEIDKLKSIIGQEVLCDADKAAARKLFENEERLGALTDKWKDRWKETQKIMQDRSLAFQHRLDAGIRMESELPHLVAMEEDLLSTGILLYHLKEGKTFVGTENSKTKPDIVVSGASILDEHCVIENNDGIVVFEPFPEALCSVNGVTVNKRTRLQQGDVVILGKTNIFRFNHPKEAEELREKRKSVGPGFGNLAMSTQFRSETDLLKKMRTSTVEKERREEHLSKQLKEARLLLEKQKQEEERRMEEARNEFARQIREESRRLQETRGELQGRLQAKFHDGLSLTELKKHLWDLEKEHDEAEVRRRNREKELSESLQEKAELIGEQRNSLDDIQEKYNQIKDDNDARLLRETRDFVARRSEQVRDVDAEIQHYVCEKEDRDVEHLRAVWLGETKKVSEQELLCEGLQDQLNSVQNTLQNNDNLSDEHKIELDAKTKSLQAEISNAQAHLEELCHYKAKTLRKYEQDVENRYEFLTWEREDLEGKKNSKKALLDADMNKLNDCLVEAQSNFDEVKANYYIAEAKENEKIAGERYKFDQLKKIAIKRTIDDQRGFNEKVARYRSLLKTGQDRIDKKKQQTETLRRELTTVMQQQRSEAGRLRAEELRVELNDTIEDVHEMERNHAVMKSEEEKVIENLLNELNAKKAQNERDSEMSQKVLQDLEGVSQKRLLTLQEEVACAENRVDHINTEQQKLEERTKFTAKCHEEATAKLDADLLYIAYLVEKQWDGKGERGKIHAAKVVLEKSTQSYRKNVEEVESESKRLWKPLVEAREQAQIVFEDLTRARDITQMTLQELNEQFAVERKNEKEQMDQIREKMVELQRTRKEEVAEAVHNSSMVSPPPDFNIEDVLVRQKQQIEDEMYEKIITMERVMQQEVEELKTREMKLIACLQKDREKLLTEKETLEKNKEEEDERSGDCARVLKEKEAELEATRGLASKEIQHLHNQLTEANNEIAVLQEKLDKYMSANSLVSSQMEDEGDLSDEEVSQLLIRVNQSEGFDEEDALIARLHETPPSPPPTPVHRFLQSVNIYRKNQIQVTVPRYILRGVGKGSYHVFEVKLGLGGDQWTVYRRYRRFRDLHLQMMKKHPVVASLEFPGRRLFGNRSEGFVRVRRAQLEVYMIALLAVLSNDTECRIYAITNRTLTKQDLALLHPFFKQGVYEANRSDTIHHSPAARRTLSYHKPTP